MKRQLLRTAILIQLACGVTCGYGLGQTSAQIDFSDPTIMPTGTSPYFVVAADFNKDGYLDLATSNTVSHSVSVFINNGNGTFKPAINYPTRGFTPYALAAGDVDGDGIQDIVCGNMFSGVISIFHGNGDGTFAEAKNVPVDPGPMFTVLADLNGDGKLDIATSNIGHDDITLLFNQGDGTFKRGQTFKTGGVIPYSMVAADFDRKGKLDLATGNIYSANVSVLKNLGNGEFATAKTYKTDSLTQILYVADFNNDGYPDIVSGNGGSDNVSVLINDKKGGFLPTVNYAVKLPQGVTAADLNGDGYLDIATANQSANTASILINKRDGTFNAAVDYPVGGLYPISVVLADLNNDGKLDMVTANSGSNNISIFLNGIKVPQVLHVSPTSNAAVQLKADGELLTPITLNFNTQLDPQSLTPENVKLIGEQSGSLPLTIHYELEQKALTISPKVDGGLENGGKGSRIHSGDKLTLLLSSGVKSTHGVRLTGGYAVTYDVGWRSPANLAGFKSHEMALGSGNRTVGVSTVDLDADGLLDMVQVNRSDSKLYVYFNSPSGMAASPLAIDTGIRQPANLKFADLTGHGAMDIILSDPDQPYLTIFYNQGSRSFSAPVTLATGAPCDDVSAADLNGDGLIDLSCTSAQSRQLIALLNKGDKNFSEALRLNIENPSVSMASADFDGDGRRDVVLASPAAHTLTVFRNNGDGVFQKKEDVLLHDDNRPYRVLTADINLDGSPDIVALDRTANTIVVLLNHGDGTFSEPKYVQLESEPTDLMLADVDGDGWIDMLVSDDTGLVLYKNSGGGNTFTVSGRLALKSTQSVAAFAAPQEEKLAIISSAAQKGVFEVQADLAGAK